MELKKVFVLMLAVNLFYTIMIFLMLAKMAPQEGRWVRFLTIEELFCPRKYFEQEDI